MPARGRELRKAKRTPRRNAAWIVLASNGVRIPCVLWDISDSGARIAAARASSLPQIFCLLLSKDGKSRRFCRVVWRNAGQLGICFIDEAAADLDFGPRVRYPRQKPAPAPPAAPPSARSPEVIASELVLPGCGPRAAVEREPRSLTISSVALGIVVLLTAASALLVLAGMQSGVDAPWALEVCERAGNFCQHPEWTIAAGAVMTVVYLAVKGMEL
jgi:PilZ domain